MISVATRVSCLMLILSMVFGCGQSQRDDGIPKCTPGASQECACALGASGVQVCQNDGSWGFCKNCAAPGCTPGAVRPCMCADDQSQGTQTCLADGTWSGCENCQGVCVCDTGPGCQPGCDCDPDECECFEDWVCGEWSECNCRDEEVRTCTDINQCNTAVDRPATVQSCSHCGDGFCDYNCESADSCPQDCEPCPCDDGPDCQDNCDCDPDCFCYEDWECGSWSSCSCLQEQTRSCNDLNECGTISNQPPTAQECNPCGNGVCDADCEDESSCPLDCGGTPGGPARLVVQSARDFPFQDPFCGVLKCEDCPVCGGSDYPPSQQFCDSYCDPWDCDDKYEFDCGHYCSECGGYSPYYCDMCVKAPGPEELYTMSDSGTQQTRITANDFRDLDPDLSKDGQQIVFASDRGGNLDIYVMSADGTAITQLSQTAEAERSPHFSPDGSRVVFVSERDGNPEIYVMDASNGGSVSRLTHTDGEDEDPAFSPDGQQIVFASNRDGNFELYIMNAADGSAVTRLTTSPGEDRQPVYLPQSSQVIFVSDRDGGSDLYRMNDDGSAVTRISMTEGAGEELPATCNGPDGAFVVFGSDRDGPMQIYRMNPDGSAVTRLTTTNYYESHPSCGAAD